MKALTIWQPWASLIAVGAKPYEFRGWPAPGFVRGQRIAVHAGARALRPREVQELLDKLGSDLAWETGLRPEIATPLLQRVLREPTILPLSAVVCTAVLGVPVNAYDIVHEFGGPLNDSSRDEHANFAWPLTEIEALVPPLEARGSQGFWNWSGQA